MKTLKLAFSSVIVSMLLVSGGYCADMVKAKQNYDRYCAACHGFNGMSSTAGVPNLRMNQGLMQPDMQIVQKLKMGSNKKPPMLGIMNDQELLDVVAYTRTIR